jgi:hypothetical protein
MTKGPDDSLTATRQLAAILYVSARPNGTLNGTLRDDSRFYRFSGLSGLPATVSQWVNEVLGPPFMTYEGAGVVDDDDAPAGRPEEE